MTATLKQKAAIAAAHGPEWIDRYHALLSRLKYEDGELIWLASARRDMIGKRAGTKDRFGYRYIHVFECGVVAVHRLIFFLHHSYMPETVDHIDGNIENNRIENLRAATIQQNAFNRIANPTSSTGIKGVGIRKIGGKTYAYAHCHKSGQRVERLHDVGELGLMPAVAKAALDAKAMREALHGEFAKH
jgi:hypothetical protein